MYENNVKDKILVYSLNMQQNITKCWWNEDLGFLDAIEFDNAALFAQLSENEKSVWNLGAF